MNQRPKQPSRLAHNGLMLLVGLSLLLACGRPPPPPPTVADDIARLTDEIAAALGMARGKARPVAEDLVSQYGDSADAIFQRYGVSAADDVDQTLAGILARAEERREQSGIISSIACDAVTDFISSGDVPTAESLSQNVTEAVLDEYRGQANTAIDHVVTTVEAFRAGDQDEAGLEFTRFLYCDLVSTIGE